MPKKESQFQSELIQEINKNVSGCMIFKMDQKQGIPDLLILHNDRWAALECKRHDHASKQPNQEYYVSKMNDMSFSKFITPENKDEVLNELFRTLKS